MVSVEGVDATEVADQVTAIRATVKADLPDGLQAQVTGPAAVQADLAAVFDGADLRLLLVTAAVVAVLLVVTYRSPVLWVIPLAVVGLADQVAAVARHAHAGRRSTSPGTSRPSASSACSSSAPAPTTRSS